MLAAAAVALLPSSTEAATFSVDFCVVNPGECSSDGFTSAILSFDEILATADTNDYNLTMTIGTTTISGKTLDEVGFKVDAAKGKVSDDGYESRPTIGGDGAGWDVWFDNVAANADSCTSDTGQQNAVCAQSPLLGLPFDGSTYVFTWVVDLGDDVDPLAVGSAVNLRANFEPSGNFSPDGGDLTTGPGPGPGPGSGTGTDVAEPSSLLLLGLAFGLGAHRVQRRRRR